MIARYDGRTTTILDTISITIMARYIKSAANVWADKLSGHLNSDDMRLDPVLFAKLDMRLGKHSTDHFASALNTRLPRCNEGRKGPTCETVDALLPDNVWRRDNNWCIPP
jgi:hypothetical protein